MPDGIKFYLTVDSFISKIQFQILQLYFKNMLNSIHVCSWHARKVFAFATDECVRTSVSVAFTFIFNKIYKLHVYEI